MKYTIALWLILAGIVYGEGFVLFEKSTGKIFGKNPMFSSDNSTVYEFSKLQPIDTTWRENEVDGKQVLNFVDWNVYDMAKFIAVTIPDPQATNDLTGVVAQDVHGQQAKAAAVAASKAAHIADANTKLCALADSVGVTNRPVDFDQVSVIIDAMTATNPQMALMLSSKVQAALLFLSLNGGDARNVK